MEKTITYFEKPGIENTDALIELVKERLEGSDIKYVAIASSTGASALKLNEALKDLDRKQTRRKWMMKPEQSLKLKEL